MTREIDTLVVHCSATTADMDIGAEEIRKWHLERGWSDIGYHYVIRRDGTLEHGRPEGKIGAHARGFNSRSLGVCLVGGSRRLDDGTLEPDSNFTFEQYDRLHELIDDLQFKRWQDEVEPLKVIGHRDVPGAHKACPSFDVGALVTNNPNWYSATSDKRKI